MIDGRAEIKTEAFFVVGFIIFSSGSASTMASTKSVAVQPNSNPSIQSPQDEKTNSAYELEKERSETSSSSGSSSSFLIPNPLAVLNVVDKSSRKRRRSPFQIAPDPQLASHSGSPSGHHHHRHHHHRHHHSRWHHHDQPDLPHFTRLLAALLLTTALAVLSALDAKQQCLQHETYALLDLVDDDNFQKAYDKAVMNEANTCIRMFRKVLIPTGVVTTTLGFLALALITRHLRYFRRRKTIPSAETSCYFSGKLLALLVIILGIQTFNITSIMLNPRTQYSYWGETDNPYQSLAAVDRYGRVGANANLYYMAWISLCLALALCYQVGTALVRTMRVARQQAAQNSLLPATSWQVSYEGDDSESRAMWFKSLYKLRVRTGIWIAALLCCLVIVASSQYVWSEVLRPFASQYTAGNRFTQVCQVVASNSNFPAQLCRRTVASWLLGVIAACLCATAIGMHWAARRSVITLNQEEETHHPMWERLLVQKRLPLRTELLLSILLSLLLGFNAVFCTGVQGPAATVGNLYYASWISFLLCVRLCLGCVEEFYDIDDIATATSPTGTNNSNTYKAPNLASPKETTADTTHHDPKLVKRPSVDTDMTDPNMTDPERDRAMRLRNYFFLGVFSVACAASAYDAACNQVGDWSTVQKYMIFAPCVSLALSTLLFTLCLYTSCYAFVSHFCMGGILSILMFGLWLVNLILTMHAEDSWAVNGIGEIKNANLYYFSWAAIISAGLQMMSYVTAVLGINKKDYMSVVWVAICKVCFVILGAALHIWNTIADNCDFDEITNGAVTFCSRTVLAIVVALAGMLVGGLVVCGRLIVAACPICRCTRVQAHVEMIISVFLVFLFGAAVALITGIGGPGQSVGDLYYSTWLAFWVSLGIFVSCYDEIKREDEEMEARRLQQEAQSTKAVDAVLV